MRSLNLLTLTFGSICFFAASSDAEGYSPRAGQVHPDFISSP